MPTKTTTKRVIDLRVGDILSSGAEVTHGPYDSVKCPKGKINIGIRYPNETEGYRRVWGKYTEVGVVTRQPELESMTNDLLRESIAKEQSKLHLDTNF